MKEQLESQIKLYQENSSKKKEEEKELSKVMNDYKFRFNEFDKSMKQSKKNFVSLRKRNCGYESSNHIVERIKSKKFGDCKWTSYIRWRQKEKKEKQITKNRGR